MRFPNFDLGGNIPTGGRRAIVDYNDVPYVQGGGGRCPGGREGNSGAVGLVLSPRLFKF